MEITKISLPKESPKFEFKQNFGLSYTAKAVPMASRHTHAKFPPSYDTNAQSSYKSLYYSYQLKKPKSNYHKHHKENINEKEKEK